MKRLGLGFTDEHPDRHRFHREVTVALNNVAGVEVRVTTPSTADAEFALRHPELGHLPREAHVLMTTVPGTLYASRMTLWTDTVSFWKFTGAAASLFVRLR